MGRSTAPGYSSISESFSSPAAYEISLSMLGIGVWAVVSTLFFWNDYLILGAIPEFYYLLILRLCFALLSVLIIWLLQFHVQTNRQFNRLAMLWGVTAAMTSITVYIVCPAFDTTRYLFDLVAIFSFYVFIPNVLAARILPSLMFTTHDIFQAFNNQARAESLPFTPVLFCFLAANAIGIFLSIYAAAMRRKEQSARQEEGRARAELVRLATTDPLTGMYNRRRLLEIAGETFSRFRRYHRPFAILLMDMDGFKQVNDTFGHQQGDKTLIEFAALVASEKRASDALGRMGGDEFCLVLPETSHEDAIRMADRIVKRCDALGLNHQALTFSISVSIGIAQAQKQDSSIDSVFSRADTALYESKNNGKNRWSSAVEMSAAPAVQ